MGQVGFTVSVTEECAHVIKVQGTSRHAPWAVPGFTSLQSTFNKRRGLAMPDVTKVDNTLDALETGA